MALFSNFFTQDWIFQLLISVIVIMTSLSVHEWAHAWTANKLGDSTARYLGRMTLNPFAHMDPIGTIAILVARVGWAKPVPVNPRNFKNPRFGMLLVSLAGPVSNILLALLTLIIGKLLLYAAAAASSALIWKLGEVFYLLCFRNVLLGVFNLLPIPPLDGSRLLSYFLPGKYYNFLMQYERYVMILIVFLAMSNMLNGPLVWMASRVMWLLEWLTFFLPTFSGVWM